MNFPYWFANLLIDTFDLQSDMVVGVTVMLGVFVMLIITGVLAAAGVLIAHCFGWIDIINKRK